MLEGIDTLEFKLPGEKDEWVAEAYKWRLPFWDWARNPEIPELFRSPSIKIRVPRAGDGSLPASESIANPLWRYECLVDGKPTPMGELPDPYKIKNIRFDDGPEDYYPVGTQEVSLFASTDHGTFSGRNAPVLADGP